MSCHDFLGFSGIITFLIVSSVTAVVVVAAAPPPRGYCAQNSSHVPSLHHNCSNKAPFSSAACYSCCHWNGAFYFHPLPFMAFIIFDCATVLECTSAQQMSPKKWPRIVVGPRLLVPLLFFYSFPYSCILEKIMEGSFSICTVFENPQKCLILNFYFACLNSVDSNISGPKFKSLLTML